VASQRVCYSDPHGSLVRWPRCARTPPGLSSQAPPEGLIASGTDERGRFMGEYVDLSGRVWAACASRRASLTGDTGFGGADMPSPRPCA
jgi:hypothetical protein